MEYAAECLFCDFVIENRPLLGIHPNSFRCNLTHAIVRPAFSMISITKANIPNYLVGSDFYNALCSEDTEEFTIPEGNLKLSPKVENLNDLKHLLDTLRYWGTMRYPDELILFLVTKRDELCQNELHLIMDKFDLFPELMRWYDCLQQSKELDFTEKCWHLRPVAGADCIPMLIECLASNSVDLVQWVVNELQRLMAYSSKTIIFVSSQLSSWFRSAQQIELLSTANQRFVAQLLTNMYNKLSLICSSETFAAILPVLVFFFNSTDEELMIASCSLLAQGAGYSDNDINIRALLNEDTAPKFLSLLEHSNAVIQAAALRIVCKIIRARSHCAQTILNLNIFPTLGEIVRDSSNRSPETRKTILATFEYLTIDFLLYHKFVYITDVEDQLLIKELLATLAEVVALGEEPALQLQCACMIVYIYSKCSDYSFTSHYYNAWRVCKRMNIVEIALADPSLKGIETALLPL